ncbi:MAG TPA: ferritin-like protein [Usitatibacter sp.]|nr:ferritin-like protein [Usitatibacter sp.]
MPAPSRVFHREQLLHLLAEAAEIEHNLLCSYLYAAFSLKHAPGDGLNDEEARAVASWRKSIMTIALEEMTHLALIANLTLAVGARPHFDRPNLPVAPGYHPADLVVKLAPFDLDTLDHFVYLERPEGVEMKDGAGFQPEVPYERSSHPGARLMPFADDYATVTEFYQRLRDALEYLARELGEATLFCGDARLQVGADLLDMPGLAAVTDLRSAVAAIDTIIFQGEGSAAANDDSHFARFSAIKAEYLRLLEARPGFRPARPVATNPVMRRPLSPDRVHVDAEAAAEMLDLANALYNLLLRLLVQAFGRHDPDPAPRRALLDHALAVMRAFAVTATHLTTLPASASRPGVNAGATFTVLRATETLLEGSGEQALLGERVDELQQRLRQMAAGAPSLQPALALLDEVARDPSLRRTRPGR